MYYHTSLTPEPSVTEFTLHSTNLLLDLPTVHLCCALSQFLRKLMARAGLDIPEALGKLSIGGPLPKTKKKKVTTSNS